MKRDCNLSFHNIKFHETTLQGKPTVVLPASEAEPAGYAINLRAVIPVTLKEY